MHTFSHDGLSFTVADTGPADGPVVVLLHGFPQTVESWRPVAAGLNAAGLRTLALAQRGYSPAARPQDRAAYRMPLLVGDVLAMLDAAGVEQADVVGHDWGGSVAWVLAAGHPDRVRTLSVLSTPHPAALARSFLGRQALKSWYMLALQLPVLPERAQLAHDAQLLRRALADSGLPADSVAEYVDRMQQPGALTAAVNWYRGMSLRELRAVGPVTVPTLYVWSTGDHYLGRTAADLTTSWVHADFQRAVLNGISHWIPETAPDEVVELVRRRVGRLADGGEVNSGR